jgi:hypothetical protein
MAATETPLLLFSFFGSRVRIDEVSVKPIEADKRQHPGSGGPQELVMVGVEDQIEKRVRTRTGKSERTDQANSSADRLHAFISPHASPNTATIERMTQPWDSARLEK